MMEQRKLISDGDMKDWNTTKKTNEVINNGKKHANMNEIDNEGLKWTKDKNETNQITSVALITCLEFLEQKNAEKSNTSRASYKESWTAQDHIVNWSCVYGGGGYVGKGILPIWHKNANLPRMAFFW
eukprot:6413727-Amphidinium_carterae.1